MINFLTVITTIAALLWLAGGIYVIYAIRHFIKRCDEIINEMAADVEQSRRELEKWQ